MNYELEDSGAQPMDPRSPPFPVLAGVEFCFLPWSLRIILALHLYMYSVFFSSRLIFKDFSTFDYCI
jgi:hypothetical protein